MRALDATQKSILRPSCRLGRCPRGYWSPDCCGESPRSAARRRRTASAQGCSNSLLVIDLASDPRNRQVFLRDMRDAGRRWSRPPDRIPDNKGKPEQFPAFALKVDIIVT